MFDLLLRPGVDCHPTYLDNFGGRQLTCCDVLGKCREMNAQLLRRLPSGERLHSHTPYVMARGLSRKISNSLPPSTKTAKDGGTRLSLLWAILRTRPIPRTKLSLVFPDPFALCFDYQITDGFVVGDAYRVEKRRDIPQSD